MGSSQGAKACRPAGNQLSAVVIALQRGFIEL
jgi:hypothetical protein